MDRKMFKAEINSATKTKGDEPSAWFSLLEKFPSAVLFDIILGKFKACYITSTGI